MKKMLFAICAGIVLLGAGCIGGGARDERWTMSFNLPQEWVMYASGGGGYISSPSEDITKATGEVILQSTTDAIHTGGSVASNITEYQGQPIRLEDFVAIRAFQLDERRSISKDAEDLGKGFFREKKCEDGGNCQANGAYNYVYYYVKGDTKYQFNIITNGNSPEEAIDIILSAKLSSIE